MRSNNYSYSVTDVDRESSNVKSLYCENTEICNRNSTYQIFLSYRKIKKEIQNKKIFARIKWQSSVNRNKIIKFKLIDKQNNNKLNEE